MGPMRASCRFARDLATSGLLDRIARVRVELYGSLALTGLGHATDRAVLLGLAGYEPATIDPSAIERTVAAVRAAKQIELVGTQKKMCIRDSGWAWAWRGRTTITMAGPTFW